MTSSTLIRQTLIMCHPSILEVLAAGESEEICMESEKTTLLIFSLFSSYQQDDIYYPQHSITTFCLTLYYSTVGSYLATNAVFLHGSLSRG